MMKTDPTPNRLSVPLQHTLSLSETAMAEMCALIFELRPKSLTQEGLLVALQK